MPTSKYEILLVEDKTDCFYRVNYINYSKNKRKSSIAVAMFTLLTLLGNISAKMIITTPNELINQLGNNGVVDHKIANLGIVPYGHSIIGNIYYSEENKYGGKSYSQPKSEIYEDLSKAVFLVIKGECSNFYKAQNVQDAGGKLVILANADNHDIYLKPNLSNHAKIHIPMITIDKEYGDKIISFYASQDSQNNVIHVQVEFSINRPDDRVEYDIWLSSANDKGLQFVQDFYRLHRRFKSDVLFQPRYFTWNCPSGSSEVKERDCLYDGKYCSFSDYSNGEKGSNIILENLRQKGIFLYAKFNGNERKWWEYIVTRNRLIQESSICYDKYSEKCSLEVHKKISISWDDTINGVNKSLNENNKEENRYLKEDQELWIKLNLHSIPMVVINGQPYFGELDPVNVFKTLCNR